MIESIPCECGTNCGKLVYQNPRSSIKNRISQSCQYRMAYDSKKSSKSKDSFFTGKKSKPEKTKFDFYKTKAWKYCSRYVLTFYADDNGYVKCSTSGKIMHVTDKNCHCGHYVKVHDMSKTNYSVALEFANLAPQSYQENIHRGGNQLVMRDWLIKIHGAKAIEELEIKKHNSCKLDVVTLDYWADYYQKKLNELLIKRGIKDFWKK